VLSPAGEQRPARRAQPARATAGRARLAAARRVCGGGRPDLHGLQHLHARKTSDSAVAAWAGGAALARARRTSIACFRRALRSRAFSGTVPPPPQRWHAVPALPLGGGVMPGPRVQDPHPTASTNAPLTAALRAFARQHYKFRPAQLDFTTRGVKLQGRPARKGDLSHANYCNFVNF
jgi:hypothetical protein